MNRISKSYPSTRKQFYAISVLSLAYVIAILDRHILVLMVQPIQTDLGINDTQMGLLIGMAFAIFYTFLAIPIGWLADQYNRKKLIALGIALWSGMTALSGLASNYYQLFLARIGVGVGEATLVPSALSMIADYFPPNTRGRAIAIFQSGIALGSGIALIVGGQLVAYAVQAGDLYLPLVGQVRPWQLVFYILGIPGLVVALIMLTVEEPPRLDRTNLDQRKLPFSDALKFIQTHKRFFSLHFLGMSIVTIQGYAFMTWVPSLFIRKWDWNIETTSLVYGSIMLLAGPLGLFFGGMIADRKFSKGELDAHMRLGVYACFIMLFFGTSMPVMDNPYLAATCLAPTTVASMYLTSAGSVALINTTPNQYRAQVSACYLFVINVIGLTLGPLSVPLISEQLLDNTDALDVGISTVIFIGGTFSLIVLKHNLSYYFSMVSKQISSQAEGIS